jgi:hypothetical protein
MGASDTALRLIARDTELKILTFCVGFLSPHLGEPYLCPRDCRRDSSLLVQRGLDGSGCEVGEVAVADAVGAELLACRFRT